MGDVIPIHSRRIFSEEEARALLPTIRRITERFAHEVQDIKEHLRFVPEEEPLSKRLQMELDLAIRRWSVKVSRLGCEPRGVWLVDFDAGNGWFSWRLGDEALSFFHPTSESGEPSPEAPFDELPT